jgi:endonuclease YncB( thermonuclease family)
MSMLTALRRRSRSRFRGRRNQASLRLWRGGRRWAWPAALIIIALLVLADRNGWLLVRQVDDLTTYHGVTARVTRIIDGDTLEVDLYDALNRTPSTRIRLWGIDCPEIGRFGESDQPWSREATTLASSLLNDRSVRLFLEPHQQRDSFARVLAHVEVADDRRSLSEALLEGGFAKADDRWAHSRLTRYAQIENLARRRAVGMWSKTK